jgi:hypothetical protein
MIDPKRYFVHRWNPDKTVDFDMLDVLLDGLY